MDNSASTIVQEILRDRESGAARLVAECKQPMYEAALALCGDHAMAEDLVFRTFERVLDRIATCRDESAFTAWMKSILRNEWLMSVRGATVRNTTPAGLPCEVECMAEPDDGAAEIEKSVDASLLRDAIDQLPTDMREAILLRYFMGLPLAKAAKILAVPVGTINSRLHYARKVLAAKLGIAAKKPGVKALLIALAFAALTAVGAAGIAAIRSVAVPEPEEAEVVLNAKSTENTEGALTGFTGFPTEGTDPEPADPSLSSQAPATNHETNGDSPQQVEAITDNSNTNIEENTMNTQSVKSAAVKVLAAAAIGAATATAANLPTGYTKVEYIQGDGSTGYLVTDFSPDPSNDTIVAEAMLTSFGNNVNPQFLFESADMTTQDPSPKQGVLLRREGVRFDYGGNGTACYSAELAATVGKRITYTVKAGRMTWTGGMHIENSDPAPAAWSGPLQILGVRFKGAATFCSSIKLYSLKVFRNNKLIHDFVPVTDDQSRATLYDVCGNSVVERNGTFTAGPAVWLKVEEIPVQPYKSGQVCEPRPKAVDLTSGATLREGTDYTLSWADNDCVGKGSVTFTGIGSFDGKSQTAFFSIAPRLPDGYKAVEYAHSSGEQFVDTGFCPNEKTRADIRFLMHSSGDYSSPFGARNDNADQFFVSGSHSAGYYFSRHGTGGTDLPGKDGYAGPGALVNKPAVIGYHKFSLNQNVFSLDEYSYSFSASATFTCPYSAYVFASHGTGGIQHPAAMELYSLKIWDDGVLVRDFVPCVKIEGNVRKVGLYDLSSNAAKRFYESGGTGELVAGAELPEPRLSGFIVVVK